MRRVALAVLVLLAAVSILTAPADSGPGGEMLAGAAVPVDVRAIIERSCRDCHSERTHYPWYSCVAPVSLLIRRDVTRGRARLNFSRWSEYTVVRRTRFLSEIANQVEEREMPLAVYTLIHRNARLSDADIEAVFRWTQSERLRLIEATAAAPQ